MSYSQNWMKTNPTEWELHIHNSHNLIINNTVSPVEQELLTLLKQLTSYVCVAESLVFYVLYFGLLFLFLEFIVLNIMLSLLWFTDYDDPDDPFGIFKLFLWNPLGEYDPDHRICRV